MTIRRLKILTALLFIMAFPPVGWSQSAHPWSGKINGYDAYIPDLNKSIRAALINNAAAWLSDSDPDWRAVAEQYNCIQLDIPLDYRQQDAGADKILGALGVASKAISGHPEIQHAYVVLFGFSAGSAAAARTASSARLSNPDSTQPPQRVLAVIALDELDPAPYLPPLSTPHLFLSDPGDRFSGLLTFVEDAKPAITHDSFARARATNEGAPLTVVAQPGHWHGGSTHGYRNKVDYKFVRVWLDEVLKQRLPDLPPQDDLAMLPDWRNHSGWLGAYDLEINTSAQPWGNSERMVNVAIGPRDSFHDHRPHIWLPSRYAAEVWRSYASSGSMPSLTPERPMEPVGAFARLPGGNPTGANDLLLNLASGPPRDPPAAQSQCRLGRDLEVIVTFDRAVVSGQAAVTAGTAEIALHPVFWSNIMIVSLSGVADAGALQVHLTNVAPADGGPPTEATVSFPCSS
ncbi:hypothetical protein RZS28_08615 [Methylocapsa polymorpha]|uniref:Uncharacterized protein n=1 Tax=Methylocapsa polymorpha TaxID=3080828 RepID=A0ABZ0HWL4_9HYPH|nr:hypothetical protein RZS28_08615 [Methylocapsa sp. RX1]